jgi:hypothetical protein
MRQAYTDELRALAQLRHQHDYDSVVRLFKAPRLSNFATGHPAEIPRQNVPLEGHASSGFVLWDGLKQGKGSRSRAWGLARSRRSKKVPDLRVC